MRTAEYIFVLIIGLFTVASAQQSSNVSAIIDSLTADYDKRIRPNYGSSPVSVGVSMYILSIHSFSESDMDYTMDFYFRQYWNDPRLAFKKLPDVEYITGDIDFGRSIWMPDTFFVTEKESFMHTMTKKNEFVKVYHTGEVVRSIRLSVTFECPMEFFNYPNDKQVCPIPVESYGFTARDIVYHWKDGKSSVAMQGSIYLPLMSVNVKNTRQDILQFTSGNYSRLELQMEFERSVNYYLMQVYIPCTMLIILCWVSFFLNKNASNMRIMLVISSLVLMVIGCLTMQSSVPKTSYNKAIDVYTGTCMTFIFFAVVEFALVLNTDHNYKEATAVPWADKVFRIIYPIAFVLFNLIYIAYY